MNASQFFKHRAGSTDAPPVEAPPAPTTSPDRPQERPSTPERPDPWRRRDIDPAEEPHPKAAYGMDMTYSDSAAQRVVANLLEDEKGI